MSEKEGRGWSIFEIIIAILIIRGCFFGDDKKKEPEEPAPPPAVEKQEEPADTNTYVVGSSDDPYSNSVSDNAFVIVDNTGGVGIVEIKQPTNNIPVGPPDGRCYVCGGAIYLRVDKTYECQLCCYKGKL